MAKSSFESVDFSKSFCTWLLQEQQGFGRFSVEAILRVSSNHKKNADPIIEEFLLLSTVIAGHVYGRQDLIIKPIYEFAAVFGQNEYKIFRTHFPFLSEQDSVSEIQNRFRHVKAVIHKVPATVHWEVEDVITAALQNCPLVAHMEYQLDSDQAAELIFPIKHINIQPATREFQVETGPILLPPKEGALGSTHCSKLIPALTASIRLNLQ